MASMHIDDDAKVGGSTRAAEVSPAYTPASDDVYDERISHVAQKYRGTDTDQHGQFWVYLIHSKACINNQMQI